MRQADPSPAPALWALAMTGRLTAAGWHELLSKQNLELSYFLMLCTPTAAQHVHGVLLVRHTAAERQVGVIFLPKCSCSRHVRAIEKSGSIENIMMDCTPCRVS